MTGIASQPQAYTPGDVDAVVRRAYAIFNERDFGALSSIYSAETTITVVPTGEMLRGVAGAEQFLRGWITAFGDARAEIDLLAQAGDVAVCEFRGVGTHTGTLATPMGDIPATGRSVTIPFCDVMRIRDGMIVSIHTYFDTASFMAQLTG